MRPKHRNDHNHGKGGWVAGNVRYSRRYPTNKPGMGRASDSKVGRPGRKRKVSPEAGEV